MLKEQIDSKNYLDPVLYAYHLKRYQFARKYVKGMTVLDSGCGEGYGSCLLSEDATCVYGIDKDKIVIEQANQRYANAKVCFLTMDVVRTDFPIAMFDMVVSFEILEHLPDHHAYLSEVVRLLKPSGLFICSTPNRIVEELHMKSIGMDYPYHIGLVDEKTFRKELERHFQAIRIYGMRRRGNWVYNTLRSLDYFNLRLRCVPYAVRTRIQSAVVDNGPQLASFGQDNIQDSIVISPRQLRQSNTLLAVCRRPSEVACEVSRDSESLQGESIKIGARSGRNPQKVLFVHCQSEIGGAETLLLSTLKYLNRERYHPFVFCFGRDDDPLVARLRELKIDHQLIVPHRVRQLSITIRTLQRLVRFIHAEDIAVVITYSLYPHLYGGILSALTGKRCVCYVMDAVFPKWYHNGLVKTLPTMIGQSHFLADSNYVRKNFQKAFPWIKSVTTVYHGIDQSCFDPALNNGSEVRKELGISQDAPVVTIVGRLQTWKGQHIFIQAVELVRKSHPNAKYLIVGGTINQIEPGYARDLCYQVKSLGLEGIVLFLGHRNDVPAIMAASDVIVHASIEPEPFGCVIAEGMAMKKPVIATNIGGPPEIIVNSATGLLVPPKDPHAMATAIQTLLSNPELSVDMGEKGRKRVEEYFTAERMTRDIEAAIEARLKL